MTLGADPDDVDPDDYGQEYFRNLINEIDSHPDWEFRPEENKPVEELVEEGSNFGWEEMYIDNTETDATLRFTIPHAYDPVLAAAGSLSQPLDGTQRKEPYEGSFGVKIKEAYESIVEDHDAEYLSTDNPDPLFQAGISIPLDYDEDTLHDSLSAAGDLSRDIQEVNDEVVAVLEEYS